MTSKKRKPSTSENHGLAVGVTDLAATSIYEKYFDFSPDAILVTDQDGQIRQVNPQCVSLFGYQASELVGRKIDMLVPLRFQAGHPRHRETFHSSPHMRPMGAGLELFALRKDGSEFPADILLSPIETDSERLVLAVVRDVSERKRAEEAVRLSEELKAERLYLEEELKTEYSFEEIVGKSALLRRVLKQVETVATTDATALIQGETGTGKELIARAIHNLSPRRKRTFVKLNCSAIPLGLLESELFGHEKGAFTGAIAQRIGRLELASGGTLLLDEVGDLPLELQPKLLRAIQEKEIERLGGSKTIAVDTRLIASTNRDLAAMVKEGLFRSDLYYRLRVFPITIPPLRARRDDIPLLVNYFVAKHARRMNRRIDVVPSQVMDALINWEWPGNVRELENFIERAVILSQGPALRAPLTELTIPSEAFPLTSDSALETAEREHILRILRETNGVIGGPNGAAVRLGLKRTTLNSKIKKLEIGRHSDR